MVSQGTLAIISADPSLSASNKVRLCSFLMMEIGEKPLSVSLGALALISVDLARSDGVAY